MTADIIDKEFAAHIKKRGMYLQMGITRDHIKVLRNHLRYGTKITLDKKLRLLQRAGWRGDAYQYTRADMLAAIKFSIKSSAAAQRLGPEYLLEKMLNDKF